MKNNDIYSDLDLYLGHISENPSFSDPITECPLTSEKFINLILENTVTSANGPICNYRRFTKVSKQIKELLNLSFKRTLFIRRLPSAGYYVHSKSKYFSKQGIYIGIRCLSDFNLVLRLLIHELCHYYISYSEYGKDIFRITKEFDAKYPLKSNENSTLFALKPTEYFALCLENAVYLKLEANSVQPKAFKAALNFEAARIKQAISELPK